MTVPHAYQQLQAFHPQFADHIDATTQLTRLPPIDAPCGHFYEPCRAPMCPCWKPPLKEDA